MLERMLKEIGPVGKIYLVGLTFLSVGMTFFQYGTGGGLISFGTGLIVYVVFRIVETV